MCGMKQQRTQLLDEQLYAKRHGDEKTAEDESTLDLLLSHQEDQVSVSGVGCRSEVLGTL